MGVLNDAENQCSKCKHIFYQYIRVSQWSLNIAGFLIYFPACGGGGLTQGEIQHCAFHVYLKTVTVLDKKESEVQKDGFQKTSSSF